MSPAWVAAFTVLAAAVLLNLVLVVGLLRRFSGVLEAAERHLHGAATTVDVGGGIPLLARVPSFEARSTDGAILTSEDLFETTTIVLFLEAECASCRQLVPDLASAVAQLDGLPLVVVLPDADAARELRIPEVVDVVLQPDRAVSRAFASEVTPHAFVVHSGGIVLDRLVPGSIEDLRLLANRQRGGDAISPQLDSVGV